MKKRIFIYIVVLILSILLYGCSKTKSKQITIKEGILNTYLFNENTLLYKTKYAHYYFSDKISKETHKSFINSTNKIYDYLKSNNVKINKINFYLSDTVNNYCDNDQNYIIFNINSNFESRINFILQGVFGSTANAGILYGLSDKIANDIEKVDSTSNIIVSDLKDFWSKEENKDIFDLTLPCLLEQFVTAEQVNYAQKTSILIVEYAISKYGLKDTIELLSQKNTDDFLNIKLEWLTNNYIDIDNTPINIEYAYYGLGIMFKTDLANWYVEEGFKDILLTSFSDYFSDNLLTGNYSELKFIISTYNSDMHRTKDFIGNIDCIKYPVLNIVFKNFPLTDINTGYYDGNQTIFCSSIGLLIHEFAHFYSLYGTKNYPERLKSEGIALYCSEIFSSIGREVSIQYMMKTNFPPQSIKGRTFLETENFLGREYKITDLMIYIDIMTYLYDAYYLPTELVTLNNLTQSGIISFINFLYQHYPNNEVSEYLSRNESILGNYKNDIELQTEWKTYIQTTYSSIQK